MKTYHASIVYNPYTLRQLSNSISATFHSGLKAIYLAICFGLLCAGAKIGLQTPRGVALICIACFLLPTARAIDKNRAEQMIKRMNGKTLTVDYTFEDEQFWCEAPGEKNSFSYDSIARMVEAPEFLYLFPNANQAYMIDRTTLTGGDMDDFKAFLAEKVGLEWTKPTSFLTLNLRQLQFNKKNTRLPR
ncbi:MAG: YcxB family protein [Oscillospiraceae bacterium]|nr:YcxB family protein [Oscillospiraceae bacterium]